MPQLRTFLNLLPSSEGDTDKFAVDQPLEVYISLVAYLFYVLTMLLVFCH